VTGVIVAGSGFSANEFMPAYAAVIQLTVAMTAFSINVVLLSEVGPVLARALPITTHEVERPSVRRPPGPLAGEIALNDVVFGYDRNSPPQIDGLSLLIPAGQFVALVGSSGSGKSTTMRLILGFEQPWSGVVSYDRNDLVDLDVAAVRRQLGTVLQASRPYGRTFRECICGPLRIPDAALWDVLQRSGLEDAVRRSPDGLDSPIGVDGGDISGGQRQRLMIARALASNPRVVLFDEATSALDNVTQRIVMDTVLGMDVTRVVIAHRLSTIERADRVVVLDSGRIVEDGRPDDLRGGDGHFARLAARQVI
jgi:ABC-type bacteriocin/lantibiotic exporter with double-glycine peptidase domain